MLNNSFFLLSKKKIFLLWVFFFILLNIIVVGSGLSDEYLVVSESYFFIETYASEWFSEDVDSALFNVIVGLDHLPLFFYLEKIIFVLFGLTSWSVFILPLILSTCTVALFFIFSYRLFSLKTAVLTTFLFTLSFYHIEHSRETEESVLFSFIFLLILYVLYIYLSSDSFVTKKIYFSPYPYMIFLLVLALGFTHNFFILALGLLMLFLGGLLLISYVYFRKYICKILFMFVVTLVTSFFSVFFIYNNTKQYSEGLCSSCSYMEMINFDFVIGQFLEIFSFIVPWGYSFDSVVNFSWLGFVFLLIICLSSLFFIIRESLILMTKKKKSFVKMIRLYVIFSGLWIILIASFIMSIIIFTRSIGYLYAFLYPMFYIFIGYALFFVCERGASKHFHCFWRNVLIVIYITILCLGIYTLYSQEYDFEFNTSIDYFFYDMEKELSLTSQDYVFYTNNAYHDMGHFVLKQKGHLNGVTIRDMMLWDDKYYNFSQNDIIEAEYVSYVKWNWGHLRINILFEEHLNNYYELLYIKDYSAYIGEVWKRK